MIDKIYEILIIVSVLLNCIGKISDIVSKLFSKHKNNRQPHKR
jgi:hypothetical protein